MDDTAYEFEFGELDGCRLVEVTYPKIIELSKLSTATARYVALWENDIPTVFLNDFSRTAVVDQARADVFLSLVRRNDTRPNFWGASYYLADNTGMAEQMAGILEAAGRRPDCIFTTRDEAIEALRQQIALKTGTPRSRRE